MTKYTLPEFEELENVTARVIFYSSLLERKTILDIAKIWGYKSANYFYQRRQKKLIDSLCNFDLIEVYGDKNNIIKSNIDLFVTDNAINNLFSIINDNLTIDLIISEYDYSIGREFLQSDEVKNLAIKQKPELDKLLKKVLFNDREKLLFKELLDNKIFQELFFSIEILKSLYSNRNNLPVDPLRYAYSIIISVLDDAYTHINRNAYSDFSFLTIDYWYIDDESYEDILTLITKYEEEHENFKLMIIKLHSIYEMLNKKVETYEGENIEIRPNMIKFIEKYFNMSTLNE